MSDIQSVKRAFAILKIVANVPEGISLADVTSVANLPKSTVARMLTTLESIAAIERVPQGEGFRLGPETAALIWQPHYLLTAIHPYLEQLAETTGETVSLALPDGEQIHYVDQIDSRYDIQMRDFTGYRVTALHAHSPGKLLLASWPEVRLSRYLKRSLEAFTAKTIIDPTVLREQLNKIRAQGYAWASDESEPGLVGLSVPINNQVGQLIAAINVYGPAFRFPSIAPDGDLARSLIDIGCKISTNLSVHQQN